MDIFSANKVTIVCSVDVFLSNSITGILQVTESGRLASPALGVAPSL